jgi:DNA-directed RNA polymerase subunit omega
MDIISLPIEYDRNKIDGKHRIVVIASQRAKELSLGAKPKIKTKAKKVTTIAIEETIGNAIEFLTGEEAKKARETAGKFDFRKLLEERKREIAGEDLTELEKDLKVYLHEKESQESKAAEDYFIERREEGAKE